MLGESRDCIIWSIMQTFWFLHLAFKSCFINTTWFNLNPTVTFISLLFLAMMKKWKMAKQEWFISSVTEGRSCIITSHANTCYLDQTQLCGWSHNRCSEHNNVNWQTKIVGCEIEKEGEVIWQNRLKSHYSFLLRPFLINREVINRWNPTVLYYLLIPTVLVQSVMFPRRILKGESAKFYTSNNYGRGNVYKCWIC